MKQCLELSAWVLPPPVSWSNGKQSLWIAVKASVVSQINVVACSNSYQSSSECNMFQKNGIHSIEDCLPSTTTLDQHSLPLWTGCFMMDTWIRGFTGSWWNHKCGSTKARRSVEDGYLCTHYVETSTFIRRTYLGDRITADNDSCQSYLLSA